MSVVTSVILTMALEEGFDPEEGLSPGLDRIAAFLRAEGFEPLAFLTPSMCNDGRHPQSLTFGGGYNHFPEDEFQHLVASMKWRKPENVVLIIQPEEGKTRIWRPA